MTRRRLQNAGLGLLVFALLSGWPQAWQRPQSSLERAQEQPFPAGSPFALLPGFTIERVTPAEKTESLHRRDLRQPRPAGRLAEQLGQRQLAARAAR